MNKKILLLVIPIFAIAGCSDDGMSPADSAKMKADLSKGGDPNSMTPEQKKSMEDYMKKRGMGGGGSPAPSAPSAPSTGN
jgi:hypothetical protein